MVPYANLSLDDIQHMRLAMDTTIRLVLAAHSMGWGIHIDLVRNIYTVDMCGKCAVFGSAEDALAFVDIKHQESLEIMD